MLYSSSFDALKKCLVGVQKYIQVMIHLFMKIVIRIHYFYHIFYLEDVTFKPLEIKSIKNIFWSQFILRQLMNLRPQKRLLRSSWEKLTVFSYAVLCTCIWSCVFVTTNDIYIIFLFIFWSQLFSLTWICIILICNKTGKAIWSTYLSASYHVEGVSSVSHNSLP